MDTYYGRLAALRNAAIARDWISEGARSLSWAEIMAACTKTGSFSLLLEMRIEEYRFDPVEQGDRGAWARVIVVELKCRFIGLSRNSAAPHRARSGRMAEIRTFSAFFECLGDQMGQQAIAFLACPCARS